MRLQKKKKFLLTVARPTILHQLVPGLTRALYQPPHGLALLGAASIVVVAVLVSGAGS